MKISEIYEKYDIMPDPRLHMLRVAAVTLTICENSNKSLDKESVIQACLLHDMGGMSKFNLGTFPSQMKRMGLKYWQNVQNKFREKYGDNEHVALHKIAQELAVPKNVYNLIEKFGFGNIPEIHKSNDVEMKICEYSDMRVSPYGVVSLNKRLNEAKERYLKREKKIYTKEQFETNIPLMQEIEKQIFAYCKIKPEDITEEKVKPLISKLKNYTIETK